MNTMENVSLIFLLVCVGALSLPHHRFRRGGECGETASKADCIKNGCAYLPDHGGKFAGCKPVASIKEVNNAGPLSKEDKATLCEKKGGTMSASGKCGEKPDFTNEKGCSAAGGRWNAKIGKCFAGVVKNEAGLKCKDATNGCSHYGELFYGDSKSEDGKPLGKEDKLVCTVGCALKFNECSCWGIGPETFKEANGKYLKGLEPDKFPFEKRMIEKMKEIYGDKKNFPLSP